MGICNDSSKFESQSLSYKQYIYFLILCYVTKLVLLLFTYVRYWYKFESKVAFLFNISFMKALNQFILFGKSRFVKEMIISNSVLCIICKQI